MKYVLTGGSSCGKTSVIVELEKRGFNVLEETAREVIMKRRDKIFDSKEKIKRQKMIFRKQLERERKIGSNKQKIFLDRCIIDTLAYCKLFLDSIPDEIAGYDFSDQYEKVFILERLPFENDGLRVETGREAQVIHNLIIKTYQFHGYDLVYVPVMSVKKRADHILNCLKGA